MENWAGPIISGLTAATASVVFVAAFGWKARDWFAREFEKVGVENKKTRDEILVLREGDRTVNERRHSENLAHFADIAVTLASKGIRIIRTNGGSYGDE